MNFAALLNRRLNWIQLNGAILIALLQRTPVLRVAAVADEMVIASPAGTLLKSVVATAAALGAVDSLAGATTLVPSSGTATGITVSTGTAVSVFYTINGTDSPPKSWTVGGTIPPGLNFSGLTAPGTVNVTTLNLAGTPTTAGAYAVTLLAWEFANGTGLKSPTYAYTITVTGSSTTTAPTITTQPASQTVTAGSSVTFGVTASGSPAPTYQWQKGGAAISGATSASYTIASAAAADAGTYTVVVTNSAGSVTSSGATLTVNAATVAPAITTQPASQTVTAGGSATFSVTATGTPAPTYQWQKAGANIAGATGASYTISNAAAADAGTYAVVVTNSAGSITSSGATLTVNAAPPPNTAPTITTQPASQTVTAGSPVTFSVSASGSPAPTYQWRKGGAAISGATGASYAIASAAAADAGTYTVVVTNSAGSVTSSGATLTVNAPPPTNTAPAITTQPASQTVNAGTPVTFSVTASGSPAPTYQWQKNGANLSGATSASYMIASAAAADAGTYTVVVTNAAGSVTSTGAMLTISPGSAGNGLLQYPVSVAEDGSGNFYVGDSSADVVAKITPAGGVSTLAGSSGMAGAVDGTGTAAQFSQPDGLALDPSGNVYLADTGNGLVRKISSGGGVSTVAGSRTARGNQDGKGSAASFNSPSGMTIDAAGNLYLTDSFNATVRKIAPDGTVTTIAGAAGARGDVDANGTAARFNFPNGIAADSSGNLYIADTYNDTIRKLAPDGTVSTLAGSAGISGANDGVGANALFNQPFGVAVDGAGVVYVADTGNSTIRKIAAGGTVTTIAGVAGVAGLGDGAGGSALFNQPHGLMVDGGGNIFVADTGNGVIREIAGSGMVSTFALTAAAPPPPTGSTGSTPPPTGTGGGGPVAAATPAAKGVGAMELWFVAALALLGALRGFGGIRAVMPQRICTSARRTFPVNKFDGTK